MGGCWSQTHCQGGTGTNLGKYAGDAARGLRPWFHIGSCLKQVLLKKRASPCLPRADVAMWCSLDAIIHQNLGDPRLMDDSELDLCRDRFSCARMRVCCRDQSHAAELHCPLTSEWPGAHPP